MKFIKNHYLWVNPFPATFDLLHFLTCRFSYSTLREIALTISCLFSATHPPFTFTSLECCKEMICNLRKNKGTGSVEGSGWVGSLFPRNVLWEGYRWCIVFLWVRRCSFSIHLRAQPERCAEDCCLRFYWEYDTVGQWRIRCCCHWGRSKVHPRSIS